METGSSTKKIVQRLVCHGGRVGLPPPTPRLVRHWFELYPGFNSTMKLDEINVLAAEYNFDVICLTETWLDNSIDANSIRLIGYCDPFRLDRNRYGGGVLAYVKNNIYCVRRFDFESPDVEILWLELKTINSRSLHLAVCYLPPNTTSLFKQTFIESISTVIESLLVDPCCCILLVGDFNDHSVGKPVQLQTNLFRTLSAYGLQQLIDLLLANVRFFIGF